MLPSSKTAASCAGLVKTYATATGQVHALRGVDLEFPAGALAAVVGPSGSGKSSLLRLLGALDRPSAGSVLVGGRDLATLSQARLRRMRRRVVGYVFQRPADNFISYLTVEEHLALADGGPDHELLAELGLEHRQRSLPRELSGGEQQRAAFAFALAAGPELVVADEPTAELDAGSAEDLLGVLERLVAKGIAFVIATHDRNVIAIADRVLALEHGVVSDSAAASVAPPAVRGGRPAAESRSPILVGEGLSKVYRRGTEEIHALEEVSLALRPGEVAGLVGRSGSGKTTLLNVLSGWERPDRGTLTWFADGAHHEVSALPWSDVALVPQSFGLVEEFTVRENVEYPARLAHKLPALAGRVDQLLADLGLDHLAGRLPVETSIGEQQRTALARALVLGPRLLLADEPTGHQDAAWTERVLAGLREAATGGTCCVVATHNPAATPYFDAVHTMSSGRLE